MKNQSPPDAWIERNPYDEQHEPDEGVYDQFPNQSLDTGDESPNESNETREDFYEWNPFRDSASNCVDSRTLEQRKVYRNSQAEINQEKDKR